MRSPAPERPLYSACNEDTRSEIRALRPRSGDLAVCVAAGGGRALSLLAAGPGRLVAVDRRASQLHALELKAAALDGLPHPLFRGFLGLDPLPEPERLDLYASLGPSLSPAARRYWDARPRLVRSGALYAGRTERALAGFAGALRRLGLFAWPRDCFAARDLDEQREILKRSAAALRRGERCWRWLLHPAVAWPATRDPSFLRSSEGAVGAYLYRRLLAWASRHLLRESFLLHLIYHGRYDPDGALPLYLTPRGSAAARRHLARLELRCARLEALVPAVPRSAPVKWSLSDVSCWMSAGRFRALVEALVAHGVPGSRLCVRHLAVRRELPRLPGLAAEPGLAAALEAGDASVFYRFGVARILPAGGLEWRPDRRGGGTHAGGVHSRRAPGERSPGPCASRPPPCAPSPPRRSPAGSPPRATPSSPSGT